ncbi:MAG: sugar O-acetyltransferase [Alistipes sp.]|nr:sugar O-acetyltransferase [Alistipes senegalensis]MCM1250547.1 sugar O-acetyltransferase [Alistipes sp.]
MKEDLFELLNDGHWLHAGANDLPEVTALLQRCADTCHEINALQPSMVQRRTELFRGLLGSVGERFVIHSPFRCDFGFNIHLGENFVGNFNLSILDEAKVIVGNNVMIGPNCSLVTIVHALLPDQRNEGIMRAQPITIGNDVWIAANVVILPGVEIGDGAVIGAGSVVVRSIPAGMLAVGNPCRPLRPITAADRVVPLF